MAVRRRKDSRAYMIDIYYHNENGKLKRSRRSAGIGVSLKEAQKLERRMKKELERKGFRIVAEKKVGVEKTHQPEKIAAFSGFAYYWFENYCRANNKLSEQHSKEMILRIHLVPFFEDQELREIEPEQITAYIAEKKGSGLSDKTINNHLAVLRKFLNTAKEWGYIEHNPMSGIKALKTAPSSFGFYTEDERDRFLAVCQEQEPYWYPFFLTSFLTGMRLGEMCALTWKDINFDSSSIRVSSSVWQGHRGTPKSGRSRAIPLHSRLKEVLLNQKGRPDELIFKAKRGTPLTRNSVRKPFRRIQEAAGLRRIRLHDIRHSFASQLIMNGQPMKVVQELLGHSDIRMTDIYSHLAPSMNQDAVEGLLSAKNEPKSRHSVGTVIDLGEFSETPEIEKARKHKGLRAV